MSKRALLIIDMQRALVTGAHRRDELVAAVNGLINRARAAAAPVIFVQHNHATYESMRRGADGWQLFGELDVRPEDERMEKQASDAFYRTTLEDRLRAFGVRELVVTGMQTEFCVDATCRSALNHGFDVVLAADGHSTGDSILKAADVIRHHNMALEHLVHPDAGIRVASAADIGFTTPAEEGD